MMFTPCSLYLSDPLQMHGMLLPYILIALLLLLYAVMRYGVEFFYIKSETCVFQEKKKKEKKKKRKERSEYASMVLGCSSLDCI
jgi:hypothetical protein